MKLFQDSGIDRQPPTLKISHQEPTAVSILSSQLYNYFIKEGRFKTAVVVCIGTDRSTGDSLGPLIGSQLAKIGLPRLDLYGTLDEPVHAMNLQETMDRIHNKYADPFIVAVDACLGQLTSVGHIQLAYGPLKPGAGVNKELPPVGNIHMTGIVNVGGFMEYFVLQNTRLSLVMKMAEVMTDVIVQAVSMPFTVQHEWESGQTSLPFDR